MTTGPGGAGLSFCQPGPTSAFASSIGGEPSHFIYMNEVVAPFLRRGQALGLDRLQDAPTGDARHCGGLIGQHVVLRHRVKDSESSITLDCTTCWKYCALTAIIPTRWKKEVRVARSKQPDKDQSIDAPWRYDGQHMTISGTKRRTGGWVTVATLEHRGASEGPLYHPLQSQAHEFGREVVELLNKYGVWLPDPGITGPISSGESAPTSDQQQETVPWQ